MNQGRINTSTAGSGRGGNVTINADTISISGEFTSVVGEPEPIFNVTDSHPSGVFTKTAGTEFCSGPCGNAGDISITTRSLTMGNGAQIDSGTSNTGHGGNITIRATDTISIAGTLTNGQPVGIFSRTIGTDPGSGNGGAIRLQAQNVSISNGAAVSAESTGAGASGSVTIEGVSSPANAIAIQGPGSGIFTSAAGEGAGGNISLNANTVQLNGGTISAATSNTAGNARGGEVHIVAGNLVQLQNGSTISSSSAGHGNAGDIVIEAGQAFQMQNSSVTTEAAHASGGNITINASGSVQLTNSQINTSVFGPPGTVGGNITIDPQVVILQNSQILAQAFQGQGGNISITTNLFLPDSTSVVDASSQSGINGTVTIQSPVSNLSANWARLQKSYLEAAALLRQRCAAKMSTGSSSLVMAGRDRIPLEPGGWLSSPVGPPTSQAGTGVAFGTRESRFHLSTSSLHDRDGEFSIRRYGISPVFHSIMDAGCTP
jgi:large exoprotein involved in heme utilization and adhesion